MRKDALKYFDTLGLSPGATADEIKQSYRVLLRRWHPDLFKPGSVMQTTAADYTSELNEAYEWLIKKRLHRQFTRKPQPTSTSPAAPPAATRQQAWRAYESAARGTERPDEAKTAEPSRPAPPASKSETSATAASVRRWRMPFAPAELLRWGLQSGAAAIVVAGLWLLGRWMESSIQSSARPEPAAAVAPVVEARPSASLPAAQAAGPASNAVPRRPEANTETLATAPATVIPQSAPLAKRLHHSPPAGAARPADFDSTQPAPAGISRSTEIDRMLDAARGELETFEVGDFKARVMAVQGPPDDAEENLLRYGSSLVYFRYGRVTAWVNRQPGLRVRPGASIGFGLLDTFTRGSSRSEVVRAQGQPTAVTGQSYYYGSSVVNFDRHWVVSWSEGDQSLKAGSLASFSYEGLAGGRPEAKTEASR